MLVNVLCLSYNKLNKIVYLIGIVFLPTYVIVNNVVRNKLINTV